MRPSAAIFFVFLQFYIDFSTAQTNQTQSYKAAVIEYHPGKLNNNSTNVKDYLEILENISGPVDVVVFPESTLNNIHSTSEVPKGEEKIVLCDSLDKKYENFLKNISCAAKKYKTAIVVNIDEREISKQNKTVYHNCDVVFNNEGAVIAKYRKWNLFGEIEKIRPPTLELPLINIKNVTFGIFTCFDILFYKPALNLTKELNVKNILFPTMWFAELPFLTAVQTQEMFAEENQVTILAANANDPKVGSGGSGIYLGQYGALDETIQALGGNKVMIKEIPNLEVKNNTLFANVTPLVEDVDALAKNMDNFHLLIDGSLNEYSSNVLNLNVTNQTQEARICNGPKNYEICCDFQVKISKNFEINNGTKYYKYLMVAASHARSFSGVRNGGIENCAIIACLNESISSCGQRFSNYSEVTWPIIFEKINVTATFKNDKNHIQYPNSLLSSILPISPEFRSWDKSVANDKVIRSHSLKNPQNRLLTFGIYGRDFSRDTERKQDEEKNSATSYNKFWFGFILLNLLLVFLTK